MLKGGVIMDVTTAGKHTHHCSWGLAAGLEKQC